MSDDINKISNDYKLEWQNDKYVDTITISKSYFEHLLNCLANQRFIGELQPNADSLSLEKIEYDNIQILNQKIIDKAWRQGMFFLRLNLQMKKAYEKMFEKMFEFLNNNIKFINYSIDNDIKKYPSDNNISFKWKQLVPQEIKMWMGLCCFSDGYKITIDCENEKYMHGFITIDDFNYTCKKRCFTPTMRHFLVDILKDIGIGTHLDHHNCLEQPIAIPIGNN